VGDFRAWLALHEMVERRQPAGKGGFARFTPDELAKLCGVTLKRARASIRRLIGAGLVRWSDGSIEFACPQRAPSVLLDDTIGRGGCVAIPRRIVRLLAGGARPAMIATALGIVLRCLSRRREGWDGRGRVKASWIATTFGVDLRRVKAARAELIGLGWIEPEASNQRIENRYGRAYLVNLEWDRIPGRRLPPPEAVERTAIATPSLNPDPLPERAKDQEPAPPGAAGFSVQKDREEEKTPEPKAPNLADVQVNELRDAGRMIELHRQAVERKLCGNSEADRLRVLTIAEHAATIGTKNPAGLFVRLLKGRLWHFATQDDEDAARRRLRAYLWPARTAVDQIPRSLVAAPVLSEDARIAREISRSLAAAGYRGDPFPQMRRLDPSWTRARWDAAMGQIG
jgi:hypothetical protein